MFLQAWGDQICSDMLSLLSKLNSLAYMSDLRLWILLHLPCIGIFLGKSRVLNIRGIRAGTQIVNGALLDYQV